jgi:hypothetical protein
VLHSCAAALLRSTSERKHATRASPGIMRYMHAINTSPALQPNEGLQLSHSAFSFSVARHGPLSLGLRSRSHLMGHLLSYRLSVTENGCAFPSKEFEEE